MTAEVGLSQLDTRSPWALAYGTRPDAMPPTHAPSANGVTIDEMAETKSRSRTCRGPDVPADTAYAAPRTTIPSTATMSAIESVDAIEPNAAGYAVQLTVSTKISHTWLASHTGAITLCAKSRMRRPSAVRAAVTCQMAAPKSAPARTT